MKIKRIQVKNIGPYVNENAFDFDVSDITKRMVLIGGKNGAGKTTLFNAIKICLYGCVAYGFESPPGTDDRGGQKRVFIFDGDHRGRCSPPPRSRR